MISEFGVYTISDPTTMEVRYVGKTNDIRQRKRSHIQVARWNPKTYVQRWISSIIKQGREPIFTMIQRCGSCECAYEAEAYWIKEFFRRGYRLCNLTCGIDGEVGEEYKNTTNKRSVSHLGKKMSEESRRNLSESLKRAYANPEVRLRVSIAKKGISRSIECRRRLSISKRILTNSQIRELKSLKSKHSFSQLGKIFGVKTSTAFNAYHGKYYVKSI